MNKYTGRREKRKEEGGERVVGGGWKGSSIGMIV